MSDAQIYDLYAQKISDITNIPYPYIIALRDNGLLNQKEARDKLIRHDYWKLMKTNKFTHNQILEKLSGIYDVNKRKILAQFKISVGILFLTKYSTNPIQEEWDISNAMQLSSESFDFRVQ